MSTDARVERLLASVLDDRGVLERLHARLAFAMTRAPWPPDDAMLYLVGVTLDHYYSAFEALAERVSRAFEGLPERGDRWHKELLEGAALDIAGVRPAMVRKTTAAALRRLLEFRHFMRHAYAVELEPEPLVDLSHGLQRLHPELLADIDAFVAALRE